jgi:PAS domain S-box-containing protein
VLRKDGGVVYCDVNSQAAAISGKPHLIGIFRDVTERKEAEEALRESEQKLRNFVDYAYEWEYWMSPEGEVVYSSPSCKRITGYSVKEFVRNPLLLQRIVVKEDRRALKAHMEKGFPRQEAHETEFRITTKSGKVRWMRHVCRSVFGLHGEFLGRRASNDDITASKRAEEKAKESEKRLRSTMDGAMEGVQIIGFDWRYKYINNAAAKQGKRPKRELLERTMMECYPGIEKTEMFAALQRCMKKRTPAHVTNRFTFPDGSTGWFELSIQPAPEGALILSADVTERQMAEENLAVVNRVLRQKTLEMAGNIKAFAIANKELIATQKALKESEERHKALFDSSRDAIMTLEPPSWRFTSGNPATVEMFACKDEADFVSRGPWQYSPPKQPDGTPSGDKAKAMIMRAMEKGSNFFEWTHRTKDGKDFPATVLLTRMTVGGKTFLQATVRDLTKSPLPAKL